MEKVTAYDKSWEVELKKIIADEALPVELRKISSTNCIEIWTWVPERKKEIGVLIQQTILIGY